MRLCGADSPLEETKDSSKFPLKTSYEDPCCKQWAWLHGAQVYKAHLVETGGGSGPTLDSARANLANTFVNAFVNAGFGQVCHLC